MEKTKQLLAALKQVSLAKGIGEITSSDFQSKITANVTPLDERLPDIKNPGIDVLLTDYVVDLMHEPAILPFGEFGRLHQDVVTRVESFMSMIAMRFAQIPKLDLQQLLLVASDKLEDSELAMRLNDIADDFSAKFPGRDPSSLGGDSVIGRIYDQSVARYVSSQVIQPLLRHVLLERSGAAKLVFVDVCEQALVYARWEKLSSRQMLVGPLLQEIVAKTTSDSWFSPYLGLRNVLGYGIEQSAMMSLPLLITSMTSEPSDDSIDGGDSMLIRSLIAVDHQEDGVLNFLAPGVRLTREQCLSNSEGEPLWVVDRVAKAGRYTPTTKDVAKVIRLFARLSGVDTASAIDLSFISRYPSWSGMIVDKDLESPFSPEFGKWLSDVMYVEFLKESTKLPTVDTSVAQLFTAPNSSDLNATIVDSLYYYALAHKVCRRTLATLLEIFRSSRDFGDEGFWADLARVMPWDGYVKTSRYFGVAERLRKFVASATLNRLSETGIESLSYFKETGVTIFQPGIDGPLDFLTKQGFVGSMSTTRYRVLPFTHTGSRVVGDIESALLRVQDVAQGVWTMRLLSKEEFETTLNIKLEDAIERGIILEASLTDSPDASKQFVVFMEAQPLHIMEYDFDGLDVLDCEFQDTDVVNDVELYKHIGLIRELDGKRLRVASYPQAWQVRKTAVALSPFRLLGAVPFSYDDLVNTSRNWMHSFNSGEPEVTELGVDSSSPNGIK